MAPLCSRLGRRIRPVLAWLGIAVMVAGLFLIDDALPFPGPWAALPVAGAALVILAGTGAERHEYLQPLTNRASGYLGNISFSLYLWHFPVIVLAEAVLVERGALYYTVCAVGMLLLAVYSYHLVENPVRRSRVLSGSRERRPARTRSAPDHSGGQDHSEQDHGNQGHGDPSRPARPRRVGRDVKLAGSAALVTAVVATVLFVLLPAPSRQIELTGTTTPAAAGPEAALQAEIRDALDDAGWPVLEPPIDEAMAGLIAPGDVLDCSGPEPMEVESCTWGDPGAERHAVVVGDSMATTWVDPLRTAFTAGPGWEFTSLGTSGCTFTEPLIRNPNPRTMAACEGRKAEAVEAVIALEPDVVFIANTYEARYLEGAEEPLTPQEWQDAMTAMVERFEGAAGQVVFLAPPPLFTDIQDCYSRFVSPSYCAGTVEEQWSTFAAAERELAAGMGALFLDPTPWFCAEQWCPSYVGGVPVKRDAVHMSPEYQEKIAPALRAELQRRGILDRGILGVSQKAP
ncbi:acyltransferase family protein [Arthrobacter sp. RIT-PI-e]|uniref:acyltransferase family protein n=1 Tax=Arthrobacter sp. RIT-PI-e TaxID=1681197 RepID=UPI000676484B|nr:acyltransferase family protein [Arthrobacter sp. RIT-PI-e]